MSTKQEVPGASQETPLQHYALGAGRLIAAVEATTLASTGINQH